MTVETATTAATADLDPRHPLVRLAEGRWALAWRVIAACPWLISAMLLWLASVRNSV